MKFQAPKGTRDFYPEDMAVRNWIMDAWRRTSLRNGFQEYDGPIFELLDLYRAKSGEGIVSELFHFEDRGGRELAIRPEMTPTLARMVGARANSLSRPIKWFSMPRLCRAERPQRGRLREFFQWNIDVLGVDDVIADAECVFVAIDFFREVGLTPADMVMKINSRSLLSALLVARGFDVDRHAEIFAVLDKRDKLPEDVFAESVQKTTRSVDEYDTLMSIARAAGHTGLDELAGIAAGNEAAEREMARLRELFRLLGEMGVGEYCAFDMGVVRGLAYYTGIVFEGFGKGELQRAICGGGRYDQLLEVLGGPPMTGVGFGTSDVVIEVVLRELGKLPTVLAEPPQVDVYLIDAAPEFFPIVLRLAGRLRQRGVRAEFSYKRQGIGKQFKAAAAARAAKAVIVGQEFADRQVVAVKDLATGQQVEMGVEAFVEECGKAQT
ncbi:MAG TPA: histidine--tRNA ligase [Phycisphaerae bacterium]|nr:histidine--tRNA ligase [Phycisphaerae bacterium]HOJ75341.1 histidine--tRNA ligase [Phycisphaerae bacterium]HOM52580.1 histidine--tRNA ligase [Phycisphaerae bacterium]HON66138.1 histidine--tRNA ligase [Phycisphaerae bacterium]HOQ87477.1 histidine--tRNA ligase [Phycisphaerae bacterium]